jgi:hypothetical protein
MVSAASWLSFAVVSASSIAYFLYLGYQKWRLIHQLRKGGVLVASHGSLSGALLIFLQPTVDGWSWWTGHLFVLDGFLKKMPLDVNVLDAWMELFKQNPDNNVFLVDLWPMYPPHLLVWDPEAANQITVKHNLGKPSG